MINFIKKIVMFFIALVIIKHLIRLSVFFLEQYRRIYYHARYRYYFPKGGDSFLHGHTEVKYPENIVIGNNVVIGPGCTLGGKSKIELGDYVRISKDVVIETAGLNFYGNLPYEHISKPILIEKGVWIGTRAIILGGVIIGENSIIGAGSIISKDIPSNSIVVGNGRILTRK